MFIKLLLCVGDHNKGRCYNREQGISCSVPMGSIHSDQGALEHRGTLLLCDIFTKKVACELGCEAYTGVFLAKYGRMCVGVRLKKSSRKWK